MVKYAVIKRPCGPVTRDPRSWATAGITSFQDFETEDAMKLWAIQNTPEPSTIVHEYIRYESLNLVVKAEIV